MTSTPRARIWHHARGELPLDVPRIMGIVNVTPDSFYDGGRYAGADAAIAQAGALLEQGADLIDVGGESTRPGAQPISAAEELDRIIPVIRGIHTRWPDAVVSVDTVKAEVAAAVMAEGVAVLNDVSGLRLDPELASIAAATGAGLVLMHSRGSVAAMASYDTAIYGDDPVGEIIGELKAAADRAQMAGVDRDHIVLDPGLGFSKRTEHTVRLLRELERVVAVGLPVLIGPSRKRFVSELAGGLAPADRLPGTIAACVTGLLHGAAIFRVHDAGPIRQALTIAANILSV